MTPELYCFPAELDTLPALMSHLYKTATHFDETSRLRAETALEELFANTVHHGYGDASGHTVWFGVLETEQELLIHYQDAAPAFDPFAQLEEHIINTLDAPLENRPVGGLGRLMVTRLADSTLYARIGERNCVELRFSPRKD